MLRLGVIVTGMALLAGSAATSTPPRAIDTRASVITVRVFKAGAFAAFGHDHVIDAPIAAGTANPAAGRVSLRVAATALRVRDQKGSEKDLAEIQKTMLGPEVLDAARYPEISFRSTAAQPAGAGRWSLRGMLTLHGQTHPLDLILNESTGHYVGHAALRQTDFGIQPVRIAGGTVRVKDEVRIDFDIRLAR